MILCKISSRLLPGLFLFPFTLPMYAQEPVAMTTDYKGRVRVMTAENQALDRQDALLKLYEGQVVQADSSARATILYFETGETFQLEARQRHVIHTSAAKKDPKKGNRTRLGALKALRQPKRLPHGSRKGLNEPPVLLYPRVGKILSETPSFAWLSSGPDTLYWIKLFQDEGVSCRIKGTLLWQQTGSDTILNYPIDTVALRAGQKYWVEIGRRSHEEAEDHGCFTFATAKERKAVQKQQRTIQKQYASHDREDVTAEVLYTSYLIEEKFYTAAYEVLKHALKQQPYNVTLQALLAHLYDQVDLHEIQPE